jgi:hypothetical protein
MKRSLSITKSSDKFCSCNSCSAKNYDNEKEPLNITIYEIKIGCMTNRLCSDCLTELIGKATIALATEKIFC